MTAKLLLATNNPGKVIEFQSLLEGIPFTLVTPSQAGIRLEVEETGKTYQENARLKALAFAQASGLLTLADDSGLEVDALNGEPGIRSSRYAGQQALDGDKVSYLLARIKDVPLEKRTARFRCVIGIATPDKKVEFCYGECQGIINLAPSGDQGFGYDPIFYFPEYQKTMAELPLDVKNRISHRGRAAREAHKVLIRMGKKL